MHLTILAVGHKMPTWCKLACDNYLLWLQKFIKCSLIEIPPAKRHKTGSKDLYQAEEARLILPKISPDDIVIALEVRGKALSTPQLANMLESTKQLGKNIAFMIGGPDGLSATCIARANQQWSLSALTFPHALARVILLEQLYRGASILANHPYHRD